MQTVGRDGNRLVASLWNEYVGETVAHGTLPVDGLYRALKDGSRNGGAADVEGMAGGALEELVCDPSGSCRVGDALSSRKVHAAIHAALRLCKGL